jgi:hypothetical protein
MDSPRRRIFTDNANKQVLKIADPGRLSNMTLRSGPAGQIAWAKLADIELTQSLMDLQRVENPPSDSISGVRLCPRSSFFRMSRGGRLYWGRDALSHAKQWNDRNLSICENVESIPPPRFTGGCGGLSNTHSKPQQLLAATQELLSSSTALRSFPVV